MIILGVETSCDDTCISILEIRNSKLKIRSNIVSSQVELHKKYGGVWPSLAKREHQKNLVPVLKNALKGAKLLVPRLFSEKRGSAGQGKRKKVNPRSRIYSTDINSILKREPELLKNLLSFLKKYQKPKIDLIAVTVGPGLEPCLWVGVNFAKALSYIWDLPIAPVNHIEAHILANLLSQIRESTKSQTPNNKQIPSFNDQKQPYWESGTPRHPTKQVKFPVVCLVVSGGHTQLILMRDFGKYKIIGETRDDAAGECFDKTARILGLGYPGGPAIAAVAAKLKTTQPRLAVEARRANYKLKTKLPRPMINQKNYDFSFSGLKTAVLYDYKKRLPKIQKSKEYIQEIAKEIQQAIIDVLIKKTIKAAKNFRVETIILGGGVAANKELRCQLKQKIKEEIPNSRLSIPDSRLCTDNAAMVGAAGYFGWLRNETKKWEKIEAEANLRVK